MITPEVPPVVDFTKMPWAAVPPALPARKSMLRALASEAGLGPGLTCEILSVPWLVSWPVTSHALNAGVGRHHVYAGVIRPTRPD